MLPEQQPIEQLHTQPVLSLPETFGQKVQKDLISLYHINTIQDINNLDNFTKLIDTHSNLTSQFSDIIKKLRELPHDITDKESFNTFYTKITQDKEEQEAFVNNPIVYIDKALGISRTIKENVQALANDKITQLKNENEKIDQNINKGKDQVATKIIEDQQLGKTVDTSNGEKKEIITKEKQQQDIIQKLYEDMPKSLNIKDKITDLHILDNQITNTGESMLNVMRRAFGYQEIPNNGKDHSDILKSNNTTDQKILSIIRYQAYLKSKSERAKTDPTQALTAQEADQVRSFSSFLSSAGIDEDAFFDGFDSDETSTTQSNERGGNNRGRGKGRGGFGELGNISLSEQGSEVIKSKTEPLTGLSENIGSIKDKTEFDSIFRNSNDGKIRSGFETEEFIKSFPYPKDTGESDFKIDNPNLPQIIKNILASTTSRPIIDTSTQDVSKMMRAKQSAILYHIIKNNPTISGDAKRSLAKILYPNKKDSWILGRSNDQIQGNIEKNLLGPLIMNTFCSEKKEQQINNETKKGYFTYINTFIKNTPGLQDFKTKSQRIEITNDGVKIPIYLEGDKRANAYLTLKDGKIYITNKFYNPSDVNSNNEITQGKVMVGYMDDIQTFRDKVTKGINPDIIKETLVTNSPPAIYEEHIQKVIDNNIRSASIDSESQSTSAGISHGLSQIKTQDSVIDTMKLRHSDGNTNIDNNKPIDSKSPFYLALRDYNTKNSEAAITKQKQPDTFDSLALIRTTMLRNSAGENEKMKDNFIALQNLIKSESFNTKIESYLQQQASDQLSQQRHLILQTLTHTNRTKSDSFSLFLKLFGTNPQPGKEQINTLDNNRFGEFIQQLHGDLNNLSVNTLIPSPHPVLGTLEKKYNTSDDDDLMASLDTITDTEKVETIIS